MTDEIFLRTVDIERPEPGADVIARLVADGHAEHGFCEKCWVESGNDASAYLSLLDEREVEYA